MTPQQFRAARAVLGLGVHELASRLKMGNSTIVRLESPDGLKTARASTVALLAGFYREQGIRFVDEGGMTGLTWPTTPKGRRRRRAS